MEFQRGLFLFEAGRSDVAEWHEADKSTASDLVVLIEPLLIVRRVLREQLGILHRRLLAIVRDDDVCLCSMTVPGVGPVVALTYRATVTCCLL